MSISINAPVDNLPSAPAYKLPIFGALNHTRPQTFIEASSANELLDKLLSDVKEFRHGPGDDLQKSKQQVPLVSMARVNESLGSSVGLADAAAVLHTQAVAFDVDHARPEQIEAFDAALKAQGWAFGKYATARYTAEKPRYRYIVPLNRPGAAGEYFRKKLWGGVQVLSGGIGDPAASDATRRSFVPSCPAGQRGGWPEPIIVKGRGVDPKELEALVSGAELAPGKLAGVEVNPPTISNDLVGNGARTRYSAKQTAEHCPAFAKAVEHNGKTATYPVWFNAIATAEHSIEGRPYVHEISSGHPTYSVDETDQKADSLSGGPPSCEKWEDAYGAGGPCLTCLHRGKVKYPALQLGAVGGAVATPAPAHLMTGAGGSDLAPFRAPWDVNPPPARDFAIGKGAEGVYAAGTTSVVSGQGGSGKTTTVARQGASIALGRAWGGLPVAKPCCVLICSGEEDAAELHRKIGAIASSEFPSSQDQQLLQQRIRLVSMIGHDVRLTAPSFGQTLRTMFVGRVVNEARDLMASTGLKHCVIVLDHVRLFVGGDPNDNEAATQGMAACADIAQQTGASVVLIAHSPKSAHSTVRDEFGYGAGDLLGASAYYDNARQVALVTPLNDSERKAFGYSPAVAQNFVAFRVVKSNYSAPWRTVHMQRKYVPAWGASYPEPIVLTPPPPKVMGAPGGPTAELEKRIVALIAAEPGRYSETSMRVQAGVTGPLQASEQKVRAALADLIASKRVKKRQPTDQERDDYSLPAQTKVVLYVD